jgi:CheY-like chemotaxis protein
LTSSVQTSAKTVLVVDDDSWLRTVLAELFLDEGYKVLQAYSGDDALRLARERAPDVIVLDLNLPGTGGLEVLRALRAAERTSLTPVIVVTGSADGATRALLNQRHQRADGVVEKPLDLGMLFSQVEQAAHYAS